MAKQTANAVLGARIRRLRKNAGLTIERLAERAQLDATYVGSVERGNENPSVRVVGSLAAALGVDLATLVASDADADLRTLRRTLASRASTLDVDELRLVLRLMDAIRL